MAQIKFMINQIPLVLRMNRVMLIKFEEFIVPDDVEI